MVARRHLAGAAPLPGRIAIESQEWDEFDALAPAIDYDGCLDSV